MNDGGWEDCNIGSPAHGDIMDYNSDNKANTDKQESQVGETLTGLEFGLWKSQFTLGLLLAGSEEILENMYLIWGM